KLKLDIKFSIERDGFYNQFSQLMRTLDALKYEMQRIEKGKYDKTHEQDIFKRKRTMKRAFTIEMDKFFKHVNEFSRALVEDLHGAGILCLNGNDILHYGRLDKEKLLRNITIREALQKLQQFSAEVGGYLNIPDFKK
ncbi:MAG: hypothetical protein AB1798_10260, partial [Spirochaetota bacterium]